MLIEASTFTESSFSKVEKCTEVPMGHTLDYHTLRRDGRPRAIYRSERVSESAKHCRADIFPNIRDDLR